MQHPAVEPRTDRLNLRLRPADGKAIREAAAIRGQKPSEFARAVLISRARTILADRGEL